MCILESLRTMLVRQLVPESLFGLYSITKYLYEEIKMYKNIIFDLYGTLIDIKTDEEKARLWQEMALFFSYNGAEYTQEELKKRYLEIVECRLAKKNDTRYPDIKIIYVLKELYAEKGVNADPVLLNSTITILRVASTEYIRLYPRVKETLDALLKQGKTLYILSNGQREFSVPEIRHLGIYGHFKSVYSSAEYGISKPDRKFFDIIVDAEGLARSECLFIGNDHTTDVQGANEAGIDCVYIHSSQSRSVDKTNARYEIWDGDFSQILKYAIEQ